MKSYSFPLFFLLIVCSESGSPPEKEQASALEQPKQDKQKPKLPVVTTPAPKTTEAPKTDEFLGPQECLDKKLTRASCDLMFCPPWQRCVQGHCSCKPPYLCPTEGVEPVCGTNHRSYTSYCQVMAVSCRTTKLLFSHFGKECKENIPKFQSSLDSTTGVIKIFLPDGNGGGENLLVCQELWDVAAANVACKEHKYSLGAASVDFVDYNFLVNNTDNKDLPNNCVNIHCQGYETSLAECEIYNKVNSSGRRVAAATCYKDPPEECGFTCANQKCISLNQTCDGVDDCGDRSDEMCCKKCRNGAFRCKTGICLHKEAVGDKQIDCLDGADESQKHLTSSLNEWNVKLPPLGKPQAQYISRKNETRANREHLEAKLFCGIPNRDIVDDTETDVRGRTSRRKRVVGGIPANPTQIQWQVALEENRRIDCGGAYIGGCWVLTAAHCVRQNPSAFKVKFSLWKKFRAQGTTDIVPVEDIRIHPNYVPATYENDIALVKLEKLPFKEECLEDNPAVRAVCVPWTTQLFQPNHTCSISGWGRTADGRSAQVLLWANVSLISGCESAYGDRFKPGMMCAGDLEGSVDSCQGDSGGPLVCEDELGVSYLWGIVSWGERCGQQGFPGVYTQVAHYFEWIRLHTGWSAVTRFNS
ncbi:complement factor I [Cyprinodon tularosa]|uniref:complement factor I n=1 Tax=Cyprinodon tularosa TaxID=77115 RepID=UPI0018E2735D|nr:complement factor I [Cyprinodon tularosa]